MSDPAAHISAVPDIVFGIMCLMLLAALTAMLGSKLRRLPFSIALVLAGILLSRGAEIIPFLAVLSEFQLTPDLVLFVFFYLSFFFECQLCFFLDFFFAFIFFAFIAHFISPY